MKNRACVHPPQPQQQGVTLIISMIVLLLLTLMGLASIQNTGLEEKMAGSLRDQNMAFQAAESALRDAEGVLASTTVLPNFDGTTAGYYAVLEGQPEHWAASRWTASAASYSGTSLATASVPRYIIEQLVATGGGSSLEAVAVQENEPLFRVTGRGVGVTSNAVVVLQSIFRR